jgi:hypothetical protein
MQQEMSDTVRAARRGSAAEATPDRYKMLVASSSHSSVGRKRILPRN